MRKERHRPALARRYSFTSAGSFPVSLLRSIYITRCVCAFLAVLLSTRSFLFCISAALLLPPSHNNSILHNNLLPVQQQQQLFVWQRTVEDSRPDSMMSSAQLRLMSDLKSIRQEPPEVPNFFFFLPLHCPASLVRSLFLWSYICCCCCCLTWLGFFFPCGISFHGNPFWVPC